MKSIFSIVCVFLFFSGAISAQDYHAVQGSSFAGSLGIGNNPASITSTPFAWDVDILSIQGKTSSNAYTVHGYSLITSAKNANSTLNAGNYKRYADANFNINVLNARFNVGRKQAFAFGLNVRGDGRLKTSRYNYHDSLGNMNEFFGINNGNSPYQANFSSSSWVEIFATYSRTIWDDPMGRLNGGLTVKATRGISGAFAQLNQVATVETDNGGATSYILQSGAARYGYSYNYDGWQNSKTTSSNVKDFVTSSRGGFSTDIGFEYLVKPQGVKTVYDEDDYYDYDWKIGVSLLDWGYNQYKYGSKSRTASSPAAVTDSILTQKFDSVTDFNNFNDSLSSIVNSFSKTAGKFKVHNPTRIVINIDRALPNNFYINAELSLNLHHALAGSKRYYTQELSLVTVTPRWETKRWGVYMPIQLNIEGRLMVGGAFKAGPLLIGVHNWANVFARNKIQNGGGYLALVIRAPSAAKAKTDKRLDCPK